jgi:hypothetical protein
LSFRILCFITGTLLGLGAWVFSASLRILDTRIHEGEYQYHTGNSRNPIAPRPSAVLPEE